MVHEPDGHKHEYSAKQSYDNRFTLERSDFVQSLLGTVVSDHEEREVGEHTSQRHELAKRQDTSCEHHEDTHRQRPLEFDDVHQEVPVEEQGYQEPQCEGWGQISEIVPDRTVESPCCDHRDCGEHQIRPQHAAECGFSGALRFFGEVTGQEHERLHNEYVDCDVDESRRGGV